MKLTLSIVSAGLLACATAFGGSGCTATTTGHIRGGLVVYSEPPPPRHVDVRVYPGYVWVDGQWMWDDYQSTWVWYDGYWVPEQTGYTYVAGAWVHSGRGYVWREPRWVAPGRQSITIKARGNVRVKATPAPGNRGNRDHRRRR